MTQYKDIDVERDTPSLVRDLERLIIQLQVMFNTKTRKYNQSNQLVSYDSQ